MVDRLEQVLNKAWAPSTVETYGTGLSAFHTFCDHAGISEEDRAPAPQEVLAIFAAALTGVYAASTISNYMAGVRAWHIIHGMPLNAQKQTMDAVLRAALILTPPDSKKAKRTPLRLETIYAIRSHLNLSTPLDAAVFACLTSTFWAAARLGEFTVKNKDHFDPQVHVKRSNMTIVTDRHGNSQCVFHIPRTKSSLTGEDVYWAKQNNDADPLAAIDNHFTINNAPPDDALFAYKLPNDKHRPLTRRAFIERINKTLKEMDLPTLQGHSIRIGATLEQLFPPI